MMTMASFGQNPVVIENAWVRVVRAANIPGQLSRPHVHLINRVMIHLDRGTMRIDNKESGVAREIPFRAGEVRWDPRVGLHTSENTGGTAIRIVEIELNDHPPREGKLALGEPPAGLRVDMENQQVRVLRGTMGHPSEYVFPTPVVAVRLSDGETHWRAAGEKWKGEGKAQEWVAVELK